MRLVTVVLVSLLVLIQYPLWWGHGGWLRVHELRGALAAQQQKNVDEKLRNERIQGEVQDLQNGTAAVEERARYEMGMVKDGEVFVQFVSPNAPLPGANAPSVTTSTRGEVSAAPLHVVPNPESRAKPDRKRGGKAAAKEKKAAHGGLPAGVGLNANDGKRRCSEMNRAFFADAARRVSARCVAAKQGGPCCSFIGRTPKQKVRSVQYQ